MKREPYPIQHTLKIKELAIEIAESLKYSILNTQVLDYPFPHQIFNNLLEAKYFESLENYFPLKDQMLPQSVVFNGPDDLSDLHRFIIDLFDKHPDKYVSWINTVKEDFWSEFRNTLCAPSFANSLFSKYMQHISKHPYSKRISDVNTKYRFNLMLQSDDSLYQIDPHTQDPIEIFILIIYLPSATNLISSGTSIYKARTADLTDLGHNRFPSNNFYRLRTSPFVRGSGIMFLKTLDSWHGVEPLTGESSRNSIYFSFGFESR